MEILKGAAVTAAIKEQVQELLKDFQGQPPKLAIVRVGERPDDLSYERGAVKGRSLSGSLRPSTRTRMWREFFF